MAEVVRLTVEEGAQDLVPDPDLQDQDHGHPHTADSRLLLDDLLHLLGGCHHDDLHRDKGHHPLAGQFRGQVRGHLQGHHHQGDDTGMVVMLFGAIA